MSQTGTRRHAVMRRQSLLACDIILTFCCCCCVWSLVVVFVMFFFFGGGGLFFFFFLMFCLWGQVAVTRTVSTYSMQTDSKPGGGGGGGGGRRIRCIKLVPSSEVGGGVRGVGVKSYTEDRPAANFVCSLQTISQ